MTFRIAIPSYKRSDIIVKKTLKTLDNLGITTDKIDVFVVDEDYDEYVSKCIGCRIIKGVKGIIEQRQFISDFYDEGQKILSLDDDIDDIDFSLSRINGLEELCNEAFSECAKRNSFIWSVYPVYNKFYREAKTELTSHLIFCIGAFYGYINRKNEPNIQLSVDKWGCKEDVERSIRFFLNDGCTLRYNRIGFKTKYCGTDGGGLGKKSERLEKMKNGAIALNQAYPEMTKVKIRKNGMYEIELKKINAFNKTEREPRILQKLDEKEFDKLSEMLSHISIPYKQGTSTRKGFGRHRATVFGLSKARYTAKIGDSAYSKKYPEIWEEIKRIGNLCVPFEFTSVHLNHNVVCPKHIDNGNAGVSVLVSFGDYTGCNIVIGETEYDTKHNPIMFNGGLLEHFNTNDLIGNKYSLVFYNAGFSQI